MMLSPGMVEAGAAMDWARMLAYLTETDRQREGPVRCRERLGGLLRYYHLEAARRPNRQTDILAPRG